MKLKKITIILIIILFAIFVLDSFKYNEIEENSNTLNSSLSKEIYSYWKSNKAEISSFELEQIRYGEIRDGKALLIFVIEPFLPEAQVKFDGIKTDEDKVEVLNSKKSSEFTYEVL